MVKIYPKLVTDFHGSFGEEQIFNSLSKLSNEWTVFHSVNWQKRNISGRITWGEADFVIMHKTYGILVVEAKSGGISFHDGEWYQTRLDNGQTNLMKNPFSQANRSKYRIKELFDDTFGQSEKIFVDKIVWFPSVSTEELKKINIPIDYDYSLILTSDSLTNPESALKRAYMYYNSVHFNQITDGGYKRIFHILLPEFNLVPAFKNVIEEYNFSFKQLTKEQEKIIDYIEYQDSIAIEGSAGTGKTFVALEYARRFSANGKALFLCFNKFLYNFLKRNYSSKNIDFYNIHTFVSKFSDNALITDANIVKELKKVNLKEMNYSLIVIDEAQDFDFNVLKYFYDFANMENINFVIFYDQNQQVIKSNFSSLIKDFDCKLTLKNNCRNTIKIQSSINSLFDLPLNYYYYSVEGIMPTLFYSDDKNKILKMIELQINELLNKGFREGDITILTLSTEEQSILADVDRIGEFYINKNNNTDYNIFFTTSKKFKGLESEVVIVVDLDIKNKSEEYIRNLYVSMSRAKMELLLFSFNDDYDFGIIGNQINSDFSPLASISSKYKVKIKKIED